MAGFFIFQNINLMGKAVLLQTVCHIADCCAAGPHEILCGINEKDISIDVLHRDCSALVEIFQRLFIDVCQLKLPVQDQIFNICSVKRIGLDYGKDTSGETVPA